MRVKTILFRQQENRWEGVKEIRVKLIVIAVSENIVLVQKTNRHSKLRISF